VSASTEVLERTSPKVKPPGSAPLRTRIQIRLRRHRLDRELISGADPNTDPLLRERARELVGERCRGQIAESLEHLLATADASIRPFTSRVPIARAAIRDSRSELEIIVERLTTRAYISARGVAMIGALLADGASPLYGNDPANLRVLRGALCAALESLENGPMLVG
jgi:hypothetical protein